MLVSGGPRIVPVGTTTFGLSDPNAPTRASGIHKFDLSLWAAKRHPHLPAKGKMRPFHGILFRMPNGEIGGTPNGPAPLVAGAAKVPIVRIPSALARRTEVIRREQRRKRVSNEAARPLLVPGISGLDVARLPRYRPGTPSEWRGQLRDLFNGQRHGTARIEQAQAPAVVSARLAFFRANSVGSVMSSQVAPVEVHPLGQRDQQLALNEVLGTAAHSATVTASADATAAQGVQNSTFFALAAVVAVAFLIFRR